MRIVVATTLFVLTLAGCGVTDEKSVTGTIERIDAQEATTFGKDKRFIVLKGNDTIYECWTAGVKTCAILREGDEVQLVAGKNQDYGLDNFVISVTITSK